MSEKRTWESDSVDELLDLSRANGQALILATANYLEQNGLPVGGWVESLASTFTGSWDPSLTLDAGELLDVMLTNYRSLGAEVVSANLEGDPASAVIYGFPSADLCQELGLDGDLALPYLDIPAALAQSHGLVWSWEQQDADRIRFVVGTTGS